MAIWRPLNGHTLHPGQRRELRLEDRNSQSVNAGTVRSGEVKLQIKRGVGTIGPLHLHGRRLRLRRQPDLTCCNRAVTSANAAVLL